jgi:hypothetical protein
MSKTIFLLQQRDSEKISIADDNTIFLDFQQDWICSGPPESTMILGQGGTIFQYDRFIDSSSGLWYRITNAGTYDGDVTVNGLEYEIIDAAKGWGVATLSSGVATVSYSGLVSGDFIQLYYQTPGGTTGAVHVSSVTPGTGFTITSSSLLDGSTIGWKVLKSWI